MVTVDARSSCIRRRSEPNFTILSIINPQTGACKHHPKVQLCGLAPYNSQWVVVRKICSKCGARPQVGGSWHIPRCERQDRLPAPPLEEQGVLVHLHVVIVLASISQRNHCNANKAVTCSTAIRCRISLLNHSKVVLRPPHRYRFHEVVVHLPEATQTSPTRQKFHLTMVAAASVGIADVVEVTRTPSPLPNPSLLPPK